MKWLIECDSMFIHKNHTHTPNKDHDDKIYFAYDRLTFNVEQQFYSHFWLTMCLIAVSLTRHTELNMTKIYFLISKIVLTLSTQSKKKKKIRDTNETAHRKNNTGEKNRAEPSSVCRRRTVLRGFESARSSSGGRSQMSDVLCQPLKYATIE